MMTDDPTAEGVAWLLDDDPAHVQRKLDECEALGLLVRDDDGQYALTPKGERWLAVSNVVRRV